MRLWEIELSPNGRMARDKTPRQKLKNQAQKSEQVDDLLAQHCYRAFAILDKLGSQSQIPSLKQMVEADPMPTFVISTDLNIVLANEASKKELKIGDLNTSVQAVFSPDNLQKITEIIANIEQYKTTSVAAIISFDLANNPSQSSDIETALLAISKIHDDKTNVDFLQFTSVQMTWDENIGNLIQNTFKLTSSELDIVERLASGKAATDIAAEKIVQDSPLKPGRKPFSKK